MQDEVKAKFRAFAERFDKAEAVPNSDLTGADLQEIAALIDGVVEIQEINLNDFPGFTSVRPLHGMDHLVDR